MSIVIAWVLIGTIFLVGISLEHKSWDARDVAQLAPAFVLLAAGWPFGVIYFALWGCKRRNRHV